MFLLRSFVTVYLAGVQEAKKANVTNNTKKIMLHYIKLSHKYVFILKIIFTFAITRKITIYFGHHKEFLPKK